MTKKIVIMGVALITALAFFAGCSSDKMNAKMYDNAGGWIKESFSSDNLTRGAFYGEERITDSAYPENRTFIVNNQEEYEEIFIEDTEELDVDFNKETIVVYTYTADSQRENYIKSVNVKDSILKILYKEKTRSGVGDTTRPFQRWFVVKLDKIDIIGADFEKNN